MHMLRCDAPHFERFGEIYFSGVNPGAIKAWHIHREMTLNYAVPVGIEHRQDTIVQPGRRYSLYGSWRF